MVNSMTGFAARKGSGHGARWAWEMRSVNARGLDIRLRLPEGLDDLEVVVRKALGAALARGSIAVGLRLQADGNAVASALDGAQLTRVLAALKKVEQQAEDQDLHLTASSAADVLALRGVMESGESGPADQSALVATLKAELPDIIADFTAARADEGRALTVILRQQLTAIAALVAEAKPAAAARQAQMAETLRVNLQRVLDNSEGVDETRLAQELALLAVKADVAEELDRLAAHIDAAEVLLQSEGPVGRKFDFLMQEFNREANTLCSKSASVDLTRIGLDLKTVIDQMREQVQNVE